MIGHILLRQSPANLNQTILPTSNSPILSQLLRSDQNLLRREVVQHDDICSGGDGFSSFCERLTFYVNSKGEAGD